ncbi:hypothetical protein [Clostridium sp.]|uniref:hypothetical protein n=1 Tax=Clostridium sp. TaxID=1506 RepID=UPI00261F7784|nr:hypothetical protein [Clostridium sp.]
MVKKYSIDLTLEELLLIDEKVSEEAQKVINKAKQENTYGFELPIINEILRKSEEIGTLTWKYKHIRSCSYCDKTYDYYTYPRSGRYHNKGDKNYDKPKYYGGIAFNEGFVTIHGSGDMCSECEKKYNVIHRLIDYIIDKDLKIQIQKNDYRPSKYLKDSVKKCYECGEEMAESTMGDLPAVMGGNYKGVCPHCGAESLLFGKSHKSTNKFIMIPNPEAKEEVQNIKLLVEEYNKKVENEEDKIKMFQSEKNNKIFYVRETKWTNGYRDVINFNVEKKTFDIGYFWQDKVSRFSDELEKYGYKMKGK